MSRGRACGGRSSRFANSTTPLPGHPQHRSSTSGCLPSWGTSAAQVQPCHPDMMKSDEVQRWKRDHCIKSFFFFKSARTTFSGSPGRFPHPAALTFLARTAWQCPSQSLGRRRGLILSEAETESSLGWGRGHSRCLDVPFRPSGRRSPGAPAPHLLQTTVGCGH